MPPIVSFQNVSLSIADKYLLHDVSFQVEKGEKFFIMGSDGAGKSTILKILAGLLNFQAGDVYIFGKCLKDLSRRELTETRKRVGVVFQEGALAASLTVLENVMLPMRYHSIYDEDVIQNRARELLTAVGMQDYCGKHPIDLNLGMKKRVAIARALGMNPELVLYDDPLVGMVGTLSKSLEDYILGLHEKLGTTSIIATNNVPFARRSSDKLVILDGGMVAACGSVKELWQGTDERVKNYFVTGYFTKSF